MDDQQKDILDLLDPLNIEARYPSAKEMLLAMLTKEKCEEIIKWTEMLALWIRSK